MNMPVNQALEGHSGTVLCAAWNEVHQKLTTSDSNGLIIVWSLHNETWYEEMINNRNKSVVVGMAWNYDGSKIAIAYQDGQVIVGTMDGNRIWNKELPGTIATCEWSPDGNILLFGMGDGEVHTYDSQGNFGQRLHMVALESVELETALAKDLRKDNIIALKWHAPTPKCRFVENESRSSPSSRKKYSPSLARLPRLQSLDSLPVPVDSRPDPRPKLLIAYAHGVVQLMRNEDDMSPIVARFPQLTVTCARWCPNGNFFAVTGQQIDMPAQENCVVHVVTAFGVKLTSLQMHCSSLTGCSWDPTGVKLALSSENLIWFANVRPRYKWGYCGHTVVYSYEKAERGDYRVLFYESKLDESYSKPVRQLAQLATGSDYCVIANRQEDTLGKCLLQLCNNIGTCIDFKYVDIEPQSISLNNWAAVIAGVDSYFIWHFLVPHKSSTPSRPVGLTSEDIIHKLDPAMITTEISGRRRRGPDPITRTCMGNKFCLLYCESGTVLKASLHDGAIQGRFSLVPNIVQMGLNISGSRLATIDSSNLLQFFDLSEDGVNKVISMDVKEVADFKWDEEQEDSIAYLSKQKLIVLRGKDAEEGISCEGYICSFRGLVVRTVLLDSFLLPNSTADKRFIIDSEIKSLRDAKQLLERLRIEEAAEFIEKNPHPRLWSLLAEVALLRLDIPTAEYAYVKMRDYCGLRFCKRVVDIQDPNLKRAEIFVHLGRVCDAEKEYLDQDRRDLAVEMHKKTDEWLRVLRLVSASSSAADDKQRIEALTNVANYHRDRQRWKEAADHYELAGKLEQLMNCYIHLDDFYGLENLAKQLPDSHPLLSKIAELFASSGLCEQSVQCFLRCGQTADAVDTCIQLNNWDKAVSLSRTHNLQDVNVLMGKYVKELSESSERSLAAVQLYRRAGRFLDGARVVYRLAEDERKKAAPCLRLKKMYVLAALLIEEYHTHNKIRLAKERKDNDTNVALNELLEEDGDLSMEDSRMIDRAWTAAQAYHFVMLAQRQLFEGDHYAAMKTSLYLTRFEIYIDPVEIHSLLALSSCACRQFSVCSRAFMRLEALADPQSEERRAYQKLALELFSRYPPTESQGKTANCTGCDKIISDYDFSCSHCEAKFPVCIASGRPMIAYQFWLCPVCKQRAYEEEIHSYKFCPLCHAQIA